jgi:putative transposase
MHAPKDKNIHIQPNHPHRKDQGENVNLATQESGAPGNTAPSAWWHSREYLPHFESAETVQHVTIRLADSLPNLIREQIEIQLKTTDPEKRSAQRKRIEAYIDAGSGSCILRQSYVAAMIEQTLFYFDSQRYRLLAWVVMPNHIHVLFQPINAWTVAKIVASWKKHTAREVRQCARASGQTAPDPVWQREYWDRYVRNEKHFAQAVDYIHANPVKAGLVAMPHMWPWSSAHIR